MKLTIRTIIVDLYPGLMALDGYNRIAKDGQREVVARENYKFGAGFRMLLGRNLALLRPEVQTYEQTQRELLQAHGDDEDLPAAERSRRATELAAALTEAQTIEIDIPLVRFKSDQLKMEKPEENPIPPSVLSMIGLLLEDMDLERPASAKAPLANGHAESARPN